MKLFCFFKFQKLIEGVDVQIQEGDRIEEGETIQEKMIARKMTKKRKKLKKWRIQRNKSNENVDYVIPKQLQPVRNADQHIIAIEIVRRVTGKFTKRLANQFWNKLRCQKLNLP